MSNISTIDSNDQNEQSKNAYFEALAKFNATAKEVHFKAQSNKNDFLNYLTKIADILPTGLIVCDKNFKIVSLNKEAQKFFSHLGVCLIGQNINKIFDNNFLFYKNHYNLHVKNGQNQNILTVFVKEHESIDYQKYYVLMFKSCENCKFYQNSIGQNPI